MHTFILQDWITIQGSGSGAGADVVQSKQDWLDLSAYQDVTFWLDVRDVGTVGGSAATVTLTFETSPTADDSLFQPMVAGTVLAAAVTPTIVKAPMYSASVPIGRFLRWRLDSSTANWVVTFRVLVAANSPGL